MGIVVEAAGGVKPNSNEGVVATLLASAPDPPFLNPPVCLVKSRRTYETFFLSFSIFPRVFFVELLAVLAWSGRG